MEENHALSKKPPLAIGSGENEEDDYEDDDPYVQSIITTEGGTSVETGVIVTYPGLEEKHQPLHLSTVLQEDDLAPLFHGTQWAGTRLWRAAVVAIDYVLHLQEQQQLHLQLEQQQQQQQNLSVLELGCGLGVPGMVLHALHPNVFSKVVLTDQKSLVHQLKQNLNHNFRQEGGEKNNKFNIHARPLSWTISSTTEKEFPPPTTEKGEDEDEEDNWNSLDKDATIESLLDEFGSFDIVLNCDCVYEPLYGRTAWMALVDTLVTLAQTNITPCLILTSVERRTADGVDQCMERLESQLQKVILQKQQQQQQDLVDPITNVDNSSTSIPKVIEKVWVDDKDPYHIIEIYAARIPGCQKKD